MFNWTTDVEKEKKKVVKEIIPAKIKRARISIRPENIAELLKDRLEVLPENLQIDILNVLEKCK
jgi:hypothetical protein